MSKWRWKRRDENIRRPISRTKWTRQNTDYDVLYRTNSQTFRCRNRVWQQQHANCMSFSMFNYVYIEMFTCRFGWSADLSNRMRNTTFYFDNFSSVTDNSAQIHCFDWFPMLIPLMVYVLTFFFWIQDVFLMIRRKKSTIFTDAKDNTTVGELKKMIEGIKYMTEYELVLVLNIAFIFVLYRELSIVQIHICD